MTVARKGIVDIVERLPLEAVRRVTFYKRDELTTDLICCDVVAGGKTWFFHEEAAEWDAVVARLSTLPGFKRDWFADISQPAFGSRPILAFAKDEGSNA